MWKKESFLIYGLLPLTQNVEAKSFRSIFFGGSNL